MFSLTGECGVHVAVFLEGSVCGYLVSDCQMTEAGLEEIVLHGPLQELGSVPLSMGKYLTFMRLFATAVEATFSLQRVSSED